MLERFAPGHGEETQPSAVRSVADDVTRPIVAEALGTGLLTFLTVAAGVLAERYSGGSIGLAMLVTALTAAAAFAVLAQTLGPLARSFFNPALAFALALSRKLPLGLALLSAAAQTAAAMLGVVLAHMVTNTGVVQMATAIQYGPPVWIGEFVASALVVFLMLRLIGGTHRAIPLLGALAVLAVALATPSLSLANPALTLARGLTDTFMSIRLTDAGIIVGCQLAGALAAWLLQWWLFAEGQRRNTTPL
jgi:glycerol uptake facilitator-like aquaporin